MLNDPEYATTPTGNELGINRGQELGVRPARRSDGPQPGRNLLLREPVRPDFGYRLVPYAGHWRAAAIPRRTAGPPNC